MIEFLLSVIIILFAVGGMALGVLAGRDSIKGGCSGVGTCSGHCSRQCDHHNDGE